MPDVSAESTPPRSARVLEVHRDRVTVLLDGVARSAVVPHDLVADDGLPITVGDRVLVEPNADRVQRIQERRSLISRRAAGTAGTLQPIAANLDTLFVVTSCNHDFNPSRIERYLTLASQGRVRPVLVLTKSDLAADPDEYVRRAAAAGLHCDVVAVDATSVESLAVLRPWLATGDTVAFVGSSGVGKSTLVNTLLRGEVQRTGGIREDDSRGRHTTTARRMFALPGGAWVIDTPGMRELGITDASADALESVFDDIAVLARRCRFRDCAHRDDAGCALTAAVADGTLEARRLASYLKLQREAELAVRSTAERRADERGFGRMVRQVMRHKRRRREE